MPTTQSAHIPPVVTWSLLMAGAWLIYASVRGLQPLAELTATLRGTASPGPVPISVSVPASAPAAEIPTVGVTVPAPPATGPEILTDLLTGGPTDLVKIGQGNHSLSKPTADAFAKWQAALGKTIPITDSYRTFAQQKAGYEADPGRFASPETSFHVKGKAVDVNLTALKANPDGNPTQKANWTALYNAATAIGWCNPRGPYKGDHKEPWHFSFPGCG